MIIMIRAYKLDLKANQKKINTILEVAKEYRKRVQLNQLYKSGKFNKNFKLNHFPNTKYIQLQLDNRVAKIETKKENGAKNFDYWIKLLTKRKNIIRFRSI